MYKSLFTLQKSLKLVTRHLTQLYLSRLNIHIKLSNDNSTILNLPICSSRKDAISFVTISGKHPQFREITHQNVAIGDSEIALTLFVADCLDDNAGLSHRDYRENCHLFINDRPADVPLLFKALRNALNYVTNISANRYPSSVAYVTLPRHWVDVNADPEKRRLKLHHVGDIAQFMEDELKAFYNLIDASKVVASGDSVDRCAAQDRPTVIAPKYVRPIRPTSVDQDLFSSLDTSLSSEIADGDECRSVAVDFDETDVVRRDDTGAVHLGDDFTLGRMPHCEGHPVRSVNLKRAVSRVSIGGCCGAC